MYHTNKRSIDLNIYKYLLVSETVDTDVIVCNMRYSIRWLIDIDIVHCVRSPFLIRCFCLFVSALLFLPTFTNKIEKE